MFVIHFGGHFEFFNMHGSCPNCFLNNTIILVALKNIDLDTKIMSLSSLEVIIWATYTMVAAILKCLSFWNLMEMGIKRVLDIISICYDPIVSWCLAHHWLVKKVSDFLSMLSHLGLGGYVMVCPIIDFVISPNKSDNKSSIT